MVNTYNSEKPSSAILAKKINDDISRYADGEIIEAVRLLGEDKICNLCEIRLALEKPVIFEIGGEMILAKDVFGKNIIADCRRINHIVNKVSDGSMYSVNETIKDGFVTVEGGHRIGFCGTAVILDSELKHIKDISAICIRISREVKGCSLPIAGHLLFGKTVLNTLIASPPGCGKTTVLRDLCRVFGSGIISGKAFKVGIADERCEIASTFGAKAQNDVGNRSFVCSGYPKVRAMQMMLRSMSPDVIVTDEIGSEEDFNAVLCARASGVSVIATAHALNIDDLIQKYGKSLLKRCFDRIVFLKGKGIADKIYREDEI